MSAVLEIPVCAACGLAAFPPHLMCSRCGAMAWHAEVAARGIAEEITLLRRAVGSDPNAPPIALASIRTELGPTVIARLDGSVAAGDDVELEMARGVIHARQALPRK